MSLMLMSVLAILCGVIWGTAEGQFARDRIVVRLAAPVAIQTRAGCTGIDSLDVLCAAHSVVEIKPLATSEPCDSALAAELGLDRTYVLRFSSSTDLRIVAQELRRDPSVEFAEPDPIGGIAWTPNDPFFPMQYGLDNMGQNGGTPDADIDAPAAWDIERGRPEIVIAILDTGIDYSHPEFQGRLVMGYDIYNDDADPLDDNGHGTHVAGIAGAGTDNAIGIAGVAPGCLLMPVKVVDSAGEGYGSQCADGIIWAADHGASVISMSLAYTANATALRDAVEYAWSKGVVLCAAMGNDGITKVYYPAALPHCIGVGAADRRSARWAFSNYGDHLDCMAPGVEIYSTMPTYPVYMSDDRGCSLGYDDLDGTSMATPFVAGVAALAMSENGALTNQDVVTIIKETCDDLQASGWDQYTGWGQVNAYRALDRAQIRSASPPNGAINAGWNWISFPLRPLDNDPASIFGSENVVNRMYRWNPTRKGIELYPDDFRTVECGVGYALLSRREQNPSYLGRPNEPNFGIEIPAAGWTWIGHPYTNETAQIILRVRNNSIAQTRTAFQDYSHPEPWLNWNFVYWDSAFANYGILVFNGSGDDAFLRPWYAYRVWSNTGDLTLIVAE